MDKLSSAYQQFHQDPLERLRVKLRRTRAAQIRTLFANPEAVSLDQFNKDIWLFESTTRLDGGEAKGLLFSETPPAAVMIQEFDEAIDEGRIELHGNYVWNPGTSVFGAALSIGEEPKQELVRAALRTLGDDRLAPLDKAKKIIELSGFGPGTATGLVMLAHPGEFAVWNSQSKEAFKRVGLESSNLARFQEEARTLRDRLGAEDFLELDWFLYLVNQGRIQVGGQGKPATRGGAVRQPGVRYWAISLGQGGRLWKQCHQDGIIAIGWDILGDLRQYASRDDIAKAIQGHRGQGPRPMNDSLACHEFCHEMKPGDIVFAKKGTGVVLGWGTINSVYCYDAGRSEYRNVRRVLWTGEGPRAVPEDARLTNKTLTEVTGNRHFLEFALPLLETASARTVEAAPRPPYTIDHALAGLFLPRDDFQYVLDALARKKNAIVQGPPGVGKSFIARRLAYALVGAEDPSRVAMIQFHQSYSYEDFIQGWRPDGSGGFERRNGVFYEFCKKADADPKSYHVFIIDEINRGNLSKIFGELFMLIEADKRGPSFAIPLTYARGGEETFFVPDNVYLLGMMNTADRSLALVDYALRRRFAFLDLRPAFHTPEFQSYLEDQGMDAGLIDMIVTRMGRLNEQVRAQKTHLGPGFEIGHSFFCPQDTEENLDVDWYRSVVRTEVAPLVREYWFDDPDTADDLIARLLA
jgi:hypothetical protein